MSYLFIFNKPPYATDSGKEALDMALAFATFDQTVSLLFIDEGVWQLNDSQLPKLVGQKEYTRLFAGLDLYDIEHLYVSQQSSEKFGLEPAQLIGNPSVVDSKSIESLIANHSQVFCL